MSITTTTIGAFPKPADAPVPVWSEMGERRRHEPTLVYDALVNEQSAQTRQTLDRMTMDAVREQVNCGITIPTDGEIRREHYVYYHCRHISGVDFKHLSPKTMRDGSWVARVPTVRKEIAAGDPFLAKDWRVAQSATDHDVKITVPGPLTVSDTIANEFYSSRADLARTLSGVINVEVRRLADAGCRWIQIDEPLFARQVDEALDFGVECVERCFAGVGPDVKRVVHICCGYPTHMDDPDPAKADAEAYFALSSALDEAKIDAVSIEDAHRPNSLKLLELFGNTAIILGLIDIANSHVESVESLRSRMIAALEHIDADRLIGAPDCGLALLPRSIAVAKLRNLVEAANSV
jgi:5-methyltetrahydropteroyltriglutamate--homocysteine methyltransferase